MTTEPFAGPDFREWRRRRALRLKQLGWKQRDIATALGPSEAAVSAWLTAAAQGGPDALRSSPSPGRPAKLSDVQQRLLPDFPRHGADAYGFRGEVRTCSRVAQVIEDEFGIRYHRGPRLAPPQGPGLDATGRHHPGHPARRGGDQALAAGRVAGATAAGPP